MTEFKEFPRTVYGPDGKHMTIQSEDERPDGWSNAPGGYEPPEDGGTKPKGDLAREKADILARLHAHDVVIPDKAGIKQLRELDEQLHEYLEKQTAAEDGEGGESSE